ncbi:hypothetical protein IKG48_01410 [Candidatus Saccharibacteria bacterium]|nr:hypothetical protein [Candidatus Saccharibacteria bacterium]
MSATTKLQFTLTSPGSNPTPTPGGSSTTTTTPTYTTVVGSPNTGENSSAGDNFSGTVFTTLFIIIGFAALAVFLVNYLKKNRRISFTERGSFHLSSRPRVLATVSLTAAIALLGGLAITNIYNNSEKDTNAASSKELDVSAASTLTFNVDRGETSTVSDTITVDAKGAKYDLIAYAEGANNKFCLESTGATCLNSVTGTLGSTDAADLSVPSTNQWGVSLSSNKIDGQVWGAAPLAETVIKKDTTDKTTDVYYGVNLGSDLPDGTYSTKVSYKAIAKNYKVTVINGYVNQTGEDTEGWFDADVTVMIRQNCSATQTFKVWTIKEGLKSAAAISQVSEKLYKFTMPANDVTVEATCEGGDEPAPGEWEIRYDKNATAATGTMNPTVVTGTSANLTANAFTYTNYVFKGWACNKTATAADFTDSQSGITQAALEGKGCAKTAGDLEANPPTRDSYTIYAIWGTDTSTVAYIQDVTPEMCNEMKLFEVKTLPDRRVETGAEKTGYTYITDSLGKHVQYSYTKYADGRCWMTQDLAYHPTGSTNLTVADTDVSVARTVTFTANGTSGDALYKTQNGYSTLYNYNAATGGYWKSTSQAANKVVPDSLCPASWKIPDASHGPADPSYGSESGELYRLWNYNVGVANGQGAGATNSWKRDFMFASSVSIGSGTVTAPHFTYNGAWNFGSGTWADLGGNAEKGQAGNYASYFLNTTTTNNGSVVPAAYNPHKPGVDNDTSDINVTDPGHGSAVRCLLRTAEERTNRNQSVATGDITAGN